MSHANLGWAALKAAANRLRPEAASLTIVNYTDYDAEMAICPGYINSEFSEGWFGVRSTSSFKIEFLIMKGVPLPVLVYARSAVGEWTGISGFWVLEGSAYKIEDARHPHNFQVVEGSGRPNLVDGKRLEVIGDTTYSLR